MMFRRTVLLVACIVSFMLPASAHARSGYADFWSYGSRLFQFFEEGKATLYERRVAAPGTRTPRSIADENGKPLFFGSSQSLEKYKGTPPPNRPYDVLTYDFPIVYQTQNAAFLPVSGSSTIFKLIYISSSGLSYATLDHSKETSEEILVETEVPIPRTHPSKAITLVNHANGKDVWVISHIEKDDSTPAENSDLFEAVLFTGTGFTQKAISSPAYVGDADIKFIKLSPDGKKLVYIAQEDGDKKHIKYNVCNFDNATGNVGFWASAAFDTVASESHAAGVSFSADGKYCYIGAGTASGKPELYQIDMEDPVNSRVLMDVTLPEGESGALIGGGQLAPDGNIYYGSGISRYELFIKNPEKAYDGTEAGAHAVFKYNINVENPIGVPTFNQSYLFKQPLELKWNTPNLQVDIDNTRLPEGTLQSYGVCWSDSGIPTVEDNKLSATDPSAPPVWDMTDYFAEGARYTIRSFAIIDGTTYYFDEKQLTWFVPPVVDASGSDTFARNEEYVHLKIAPVADCSYQWLQIGGLDVGYYKKTANSTSFRMPESDVVMRVTVTDASGTSASKVLYIKNGIGAVIETPLDVGNGDWVALTGKEIRGATYHWEQVDGPSITIANPDTRTAHFDATEIPDGTLLTFKLTVSDEFGNSGVTTKVITVRNSPVITFDNIVSKAKAGEKVDLKVQPVAGVNYVWTKTGGVPVTLNDPNTPHAYFVMSASAKTMSFKVVATDSYGIKSTKSVSITRDAPPVAQAGPDQNVTEGNTVTLTADGSSDPMGEELSFTWTQASGTPVTLTTVTNSSRTFIAPVVPAAGDSLVFQLQATDPGGQNATDTVTINVTYINDPPVANAGPDQKAETWSEVTLNGTNSYDPDKQFLTYKWEQIDGKTVTIHGDTTAKPTFTAPDVSGALKFRLTVDDGQGLTTTDDVICNVVTSGSNELPPVADAGPNCTVEYGTPVTLNAFNSYARGTDNYLKLYSWKLISDNGTPVTLDTPTAARTSFTAPDSTTRLVFMLTVTDNNELESTDTVVINVIDAGTPPVADAGNDQLVPSGTVGVTLDASGSLAPGSSIVSYLWNQISGIPVDLSDVTVPNPIFDAPTADSNGEAIAFLLTVTNAEGITDSDTVIVNIDGGGVLMPTAVANNDVDDSGKSVEGATVTLDASGSYANGEATLTSCSWKQVSGPMAPLSDPSAISPTFVCPATDVETSLVFELTITDSNNMESTGRTTVVYLPNSFSDIDDGQIAFTAYDGVQHIGIASKEPEEGSGNALGAIVALTPVDPSGVTGTGTAPSSMPYGLIDFKIRVEQPGDSTEVIVEFPEAAPASWVKLDSSGAWIDYTEHVTYNGDRTVATIRLVDGGIGDDDGIANGIIVDPSGPGTYASSSSSSNGSSSGGGGCTMTPSAPFTIDLLLLLGGCVGLILYRRKKRKTVQ